MPSVSGSHRSHSSRRSHSSHKAKKSSGSDKASKVFREKSQAKVATKVKSLRGSSRGKSTARTAGASDRVYHSSRSKSSNTSRVVPRTLQPINASKTLLNIFRKNPPPCSNPCCHDPLFCEMPSCFLGCCVPLQKKDKQEARSDACLCSCESLRCCDSGEGCLIGCVAGIFCCACLTCYSACKACYQSSLINHHIQYDGPAAQLMDF